MIRLLVILVSCWRQVNVSAIIALVARKLLQALFILREASNRPGIVLTEISVECPYRLRT